MGEELGLLEGLELGAELGLFEGKLLGKELGAPLSVGLADGALLG